MTPFTTLTATAAPLPLDNVDTDKILPAKYLRTIHRAGLGKALFATLRADEGFVLNRSPWNRAGILVAGANFGCGSSREHAPWALLDFGIRCVIASGFADIFYGNCIKNGILPIVLPGAQVARLQELAANAATATFTVDLESRCIAAGELKIDYELDLKHRHALLNGIDELAVSLTHLAAIDAHEAQKWQSRPWEKATPYRPE